MPISRCDGAIEAADEARQIYSVSSQVGFLLRKAQQRHVSVFTGHIGEDLTPMQFAVLAKLREAGPWWRGWRSAAWSASSHRPRTGASC
jgi:hypothetical protein